jgi:Metal binding domain of Ada
MKKVALICILVVFAAVLTVGSLSINVSGDHTSTPGVSNTAAQSTSAASTMHIANDPLIKTPKQPVLTANQLFRRQSYRGPYYASSKSLTKRYHYPGCFEVANIETENLIAFNTHLEACAAGFKPCVRCNPPPFNGASY